MGGQTWTRLGLGLALLLGGRAFAAGQEAPPPLEGPRGAGEATAATGPTDDQIGVLEEDGRPAADEPAVASRPVHEVLTAGERPDRSAERIGTSPPPPESEGPTPEEGPSPSARWVAGYWDWDAGRGAFAWVPGLWVVPPEGRSWVEGRWRRDERGWYRIPGRWEEAPRAAAAGDWRRTGPPERPAEDDPGPAPGPGYFRVPGEYEPDGEELAWRPGFWARSQPGWSWTPGAWVEGEDGWRFEPGRWEPEAGASGGEAAGLEPIDERDDAVARASAGSPDPGASPTRAEGLPEAIDPDEPGPLPPLPSGGLPAPGAPDAGVRRASPVPAPVVDDSRAALLGWADRLAGQSDAFYRNFAPTAGAVPQGGAMLYEASNLRAAAFRLRQAVAAGADPEQVRFAAEQADGWWRRLAARVQAVARGRTGPNIQLVMDMGATCEQVRLASLGATPAGVGPVPEGLATTSYRVEPAAPAAPPFYGPPPGVVVRRPAPAVPVRGLINRLRRLR